MATFKDSTKRDWGLVITGLLGLALFFWLYSEYNPLSLSDTSLNENLAIEKSMQIFTTLGFSSDLEPKTRYRVNSSLLDTLQAETDFRQFYSSEENRNRLPVFFWVSSFYMEPAGPGSPMLSDSRAKLIQIELSESGELMALRNEHNFFPENILYRRIFNEALDVPITGDAISDSLLSERLLFNFNVKEEEDSVKLQIDLNRQNFLGKEHAEEMALYYLNQSLWNADEFNVSSVEKIIVNDTDAARVIFRSEDGEVFTQREITAVVAATGPLISLSYDLQSMQADSGISTNQMISNIRGGIILLGVFWVLILLIIRFRLRLIDMKVAILVAVLAGFIFPFIMLMEMIYGHIYSFGAFSFSYLLTLIMSSGVVAALTSVIFFMVTSISDSITRENWAIKLRTVDLIRTGHFASRPVGLALVRGTLYSFLIAGGWALMLAILPGSYISVESVFFSSERFVPNIVMVLNNLLWLFIVSEAIFLILIGYLRSFTKSALITVLTTGFVFALMNPLVIDIGPLYTEFIMLAGVGVVSGLIYRYEDFLTVFITLFFTTGLLSSASGWLLENSPDSSLFYTQIILLAGAFLYGGYCILKGKTIQELPEFVPDYIEELAQEERIKQELQIARKVQQSFLPESTPEFKGLDIAAICKPAHETGGDYYDFIALDDNRLAVTIGDVSGKGIQAAFYMTFTKGVLHAICEDFKSTIEVLSKTNTLFRRNSKRGTFVSLIFGVVDLTQDTFSFSRAGHNPLLYFSSKDSKLYEYAPLGIGLGMAGNMIFSNNIKEQTIRLAEDDLLVMFTDGVVEATNKMGKFYGDGRLHKLIKNNSKLGAEALLNKIMKDLEEFSLNASQHDDMTMLIIKKQ